MAKTIEEINDIMSNLSRKLRFDEGKTISKSDIVQLFYGQNSPLYFIFRDRMGWSYDTFPLFSTCCKLADFNMCITKAKKKHHR